jgi:DNA-binding beta-propeller fold protein YncE
VATGERYPRSVTIAPSGKFAYVVNSGFTADGTISAYTINAATGALTSVGVPVAAQWGPQPLTVDPSGKFAYVSNVFDDAIQPGKGSAYAIDATTGALARVGAAVPAGIYPQRVTVDPSGKFAYVANPYSNDVSGYTIDAATGALSEVAGSPFAAGFNPASITITRTIQ